jgi:hypothetical protein
VILWLSWVVLVDRLLFFWWAFALAVSLSVRFSFFFFFDSFAWLFTNLFLFHSLSLLSTRHFRRS